MRDEEDNYGPGAGLTGRPAPQQLFFTLGKRFSWTKKKKNSLIKNSDLSRTFSSVVLRTPPHNYLYS